MAALERTPAIILHPSILSIPSLALPAPALPVFKAISAGISSLCQCQDTEGLFDLKEGQRNQLQKSPFHGLIFSSQFCHLNKCQQKGMLYLSHGSHVSLKPLAVELLNHSSCTHSSIHHTLCHLALSFLQQCSFKTPIVRAVNTFDAASLLLQIKLRAWKWENTNSRHALYK